MYNKPLVTVFIPVYNVELYIRECLNSIVNQTYANIEILIIDDGSTDRSVEIIKEFKDERIRLLYNGSNKGLPYTRNRGILEAKGKYLALMDSDDISLKNRINKQVDFLEKNNDIDVVSSNILTFPCGLLKNIVRYIRCIFNKSISEEEVKISLLFSNIISNPASMIRMETIKNLGLSYNDKCFVAQDYDFWSKLSKNNKIYILKDTLLKYRFGHMNITKISSQKNLEKRNEIINNIKVDLLDYYGFNISETNKNIFLELFSEIPFNFGYNCNLKNSKIMINELLSINNEKLIFDSEMLVKVINRNIYSKILAYNGNLLYKIRIYKELFLKRNLFVDFKNILYLTLRSYI